MRRKGEERRERREEKERKKYFAFFVRGCGIGCGVRGLGRVEYGVCGEEV